MPTDTALTFTAFSNDTVVPFNPIHTKTHDNQIHNHNIRSADRSSELNGKGMAWDSATEVHAYRCRASLRETRQVGHYEVGDERVSFEYSDGPCTDLYRALGKDNCYCWLKIGTVTSIFVKPTMQRRVSNLKLDMEKFKRTPITPFPYTFEYSNRTEGPTKSTSHIPRSEILNTMLPRLIARTSSRAMLQSTEIVGAA